MKHTAWRYENWRSTEIDLPEPEHPGESRKAAMIRGGWEHIADFHSRPLVSVALYRQSEYLAVVSIDKNAVGHILVKPGPTFLGFLRDWILPLSQR